MFKDERNWVFVVFGIAVIAAGILISGFLW